MSLFVLGVKYWFKDSSCLASIPEKNVHLFSFNIASRPFSPAFSFRVPLCMSRESCLSFNGSQRFFLSVKGQIANVAAFVDRTASVARTGFSQGGTTVTLGM